MEYLVGMQVVESIQKIKERLQELKRRTFPLRARRAGGERRAINILTGVVGYVPFLRVPKIIGASNLWMMQGGNASKFKLELFEARPIQTLSLEDLQRDRAAPSFVVSEVDGAHAPRAELSLDCITAGEEQSCAF